MATKPKEKTRVRVEKWFTPKEAHTIASQFRTQARVIREQANALRKERSTLDSSWEGNSRNNFMQLLDPVPGNLESFAQWLESQANKIENLKALKYEYEYE